MVQVVPSESLHSGVTTKTIPLTKRSSSFEDDGRAETKHMTKTNAAEEHIEGNATDMVVEPVRSTGVGGDKFGDSHEAVRSELLTQIVAAEDVLGGGGPREAFLQDGDDEKEHKNSNKVGEINLG